MSRTFDAIVIGAGQAGPPLAGRLTAAGMTVALIERKLFGGTCVNTGCMPTKTLVASAYAAHLARRAGDFGVTIDGAVARRHDSGSRRAPTRSSRESRAAASKHWLRGMDGLHRHPAATPASSRPARSRGRRRACSRPPRIFINVGGRALVPDMPGVDDVRYLTNSSMLELDTLPEHLVVVGGSYVGLEFAQMYRRFGAEVTVVEKGAAADRARGRGRLGGRPRDPRSARASRSALDAECIRFAPHGEASRSASTARRASRRSSARTCCSRSAAARTPTTSGSTRPASRPTRAATSWSTTSSRTNVPGIWALGDCNGRGAFTHTAYNDFEIVAANLLDGEPRRVSDRIPGYALYIDPPLGRVGHDRGAGAQARAGRSWSARADDARRPRGREGRDAGLHEGRRRRRDEAKSSAPPSSAPAATRRSTASSTSCMRRRPARRCSGPCPSTRPSRS